MDRDDVEVLRRRLYAPGASLDDVDRYRGLGAVPRVVPRVTPPEDRPEDRPPAPRARRRTLVAPLLIAALVLAGLALAQVVARAATPAVVAVVRAPDVVVLTSADRDAVREALAARNDVAVASFLVAHRAPPALRTATRSLLVEQTGVGTATVDVDPASAAAFRGRATVLLVLERPGRVGWTTFRRDVDASGALVLERQQRREGQQAAGALTAATYRYGSGEQPVQVRVDAPAGVRWAVEVVYSD